LGRTKEHDYFTRQYIPEDNSEHHTRRRENLKSHRTRLINGTKERSKIGKYILIHVVVFYVLFNQYQKELL
jgi:hypothetical protein